MSSSFDEPYVSVSNNKLECGRKLLADSRWTLRNAAGASGDDWAASTSASSSIVAPLSRVRWKFPASVADNDSTSVHANTQRYQHHNLLYNCNLVISRRMNRINSYKKQRSKDKTIHLIIKPPLATARAASCNGPVHLFVCLFVCLFVSLSPKYKNAIFSKTKHFRAMVSIDHI